MTGPEVFGSTPYAANRPVEGRLVTVLRGVTGERGLSLEGYRSRAVISGHIHEFMTTDDPAAVPGTTVDRVALIGFFVVERSGVLLVGAEVVIGDQTLGTIAGFDNTHMPNHQNICIRVNDFRDGVDLGFAVGDPISIRWTGGRP
ncbi:hypothetical protein BH23CHL2_BH23CHL2_30180 [soil metagenome]